MVLGAGGSQGMQPGTREGWGQGAVLRCSVDTRCWREGAGGGTQPWGPPDVADQQE